MSENIGMKFVAIDNKEVMDALGKVVTDILNSRVPWWTKAKIVNSVLSKMAPKDMVISNCTILMGKNMETKKKKEKA